MQLEPMAVTPRVTKRMRAARMVGPHQLRVEEIVMPEPGPRQLRIRVQGCGVSPSSLPIWAGASAQTYPLLAGQPGDEAWGVVDALGSEVRSFREGDRVAVVGHQGYAEYEVVDARAALKLPEELKDLPFPGKSLGGALNVFERSRILAGQLVAVVGVGFLGALVTRLATVAGARVIALSRRAFSLAVAREMGATAVIEAVAHDQAVAEVAELTLGELCETVIETTGHQNALSLASRLVSRRGSLVIAGRHEDGPRQVDLSLWSDRGIDVINPHERQPDAQLTSMKAALQALESGQLEPTSLYTHPLGLERLAEALDLAQNRPLGFIKALVVP